MPESTSQTYKTIVTAHNRESASNPVSSRITSHIMSAFPPHRSIPSIPVPPETALKYLSAYLEAAKTSPHLLPNARLEPSGPTAGSSNSSVTIYNLQRVEAGLRGEWLAPSLDVEDNVGVTQGMDDGMNNGQGDRMQVDGWQSLDEYQLEQEEVEGDIAPRETGIGQEGDSELENELEVEPPKAAKTKRKSEHVESSGKTEKDKKLRKEEKKLRAKEDKRRRNLEKQGLASED